MNNINKLKNEFPELLKNTLLNIKDGWIELTRNMLLIIKTQCDSNDLEIFEIKEKMGRASVIFKNGNEEISNFIFLYEEQSSTVCEICGKKGFLWKQDRGLFYTACKEHKLENSTLSI